MTKMTKNQKRKKRTNQKIKISPKKRMKKIMMKMM